MRRNEGFWDRAIRVIVGVALLAWATLKLGALAGGGWGLLVGVAGLVLLATGLAGSCPLYALLGIRTCPLEGERR